MSKLIQWTTIPISGRQLLRDHARCITAGVPYKWGGKPSADTAPEAMKGADCSGYVGWLVTRACGSDRADRLAKVAWCGRGTFWFANACRQAGFKRSDVASGTRKDGIVRLAVMVADGKSVRIGHIALILDGITYECYGSRGVGSREWTGTGWQKLALVYCLAELPTIPAVNRTIAKENDYVIPVTVDTNGAKGGSVARAVSDPGIGEGDARTSWANLGAEGRADTIGRWI